MAREKLQVKIGRRLREIRRDHNLTGKEVVKKFNLHIDVSTLSRYETGAVLQSIEFIVMFAQYFEVDLNWLFHGAGSKYQDSKFEGRDRTEAELLEDIRIQLKENPFDNDFRDTDEFDITSDNIENYLELLKIMIMDRRTRKDMFKYFFMIERNQAIKRFSVSEDPE
jgi:transcriptional regulator with XRE-family HTH domain